MARPTSVVPVVRPGTQARLIRLVGRRFALVWHGLPPVPDRATIGPRTPLAPEAALPLTRPVVEPALFAVAVEPSFDVRRRLPQTPTMPVLVTAPVPQVVPPSLAEVGRFVDILGEVVTYMGLVLAEILAPTVGAPVAKDTRPAKAVAVVPGDIARSPAAKVIKAVTRPVGLPRPRRASPFLATVVAFRRPSVTARRPATFPGRPVTASSLAPPVFRHALGRPVNAVRPVAMVVVGHKAA